MQLTCPICRRYGTTGAPSALRPTLRSLLVWLSKPRFEARTRDPDAASDLDRVDVPSSDRLVELPTPNAEDSAGLVNSEHQWQLAEGHARGDGTLRYFHLHLRAPPAERVGSRETRPSRSRDRMNRSSEATMMVWSASLSPIRTLASLSIRFSRTNSSASRRRLRS